MSIEELMEKHRIPAKSYTVSFQDSMFNQDVIYFASGIGRFVPIELERELGKKGYLVIKNK